MREEEAGEVRVEAFVPRDQLVGESETRHEAALLQPEDGGEGAREEDAFDGGEGDKALSEGAVFILNPLDGPVRLLADAGN